MIELRRKDNREKLVVECNCGSSNRMLKSSTKVLNALKIERLEAMADVAAAVSIMLCDKSSTCMLAKSEACSSPGMRRHGNEHKCKPLKFASVSE